MSRSCPQAPKGRLGFGSVFTASSPGGDATADRAVLGVGQVVAEFDSATATRRILRWAAEGLSSPSLGLGSRLQSAFSGNFGEIFGSGRCLEFAPARKRLGILFCQISRFQWILIHVRPPSRLRHAGRTVGVRSLPNTSTLLHRPHLTSDPQPPRMCHPHEGQTDLITDGSVTSDSPTTAQRSPTAGT